MRRCGNRPPKILARESRRTGKRAEMRVRWRGAYAVAVVLVLVGCAPKPVLQLRSGAPFNRIHFASVDLYECRQAAGLPGAAWEYPPVETFTAWANIYLKLAATWECVDARGYEFTPAAIALVAREISKTPTTIAADPGTFFQHQSGIPVTPANLASVRVECEKEAGMPSMTHLQLRSLAELAALSRKLGAHLACLGARGYLLSPDFVRAIKDQGGFWGAFLQR